ncbi:hypothetical protein O181_072603 [Austropuccinia psidii MF-1]|uniref:Uncharacterized protein n=1 Tax=Austropuccinia psidii MF-1 TaxID=1389203 RepID=A0A9Q3F7P0_9BASI|nr:hypothetical protein [Austropuccinia psidii MF-1]
MLANKHTRNALLLSKPSDHVARGVSDQDALERNPLWSTMMKAFPSGNGCGEQKQADGNDSRQLAQSPQVLIFPPPLLCHHLMVTPLLDQSKLIICPMEDGNGKRTFELGPIVTMSCHPWDSNAETLPFLVCFASKLRGNQWWEDLFHGKQPKFHLISTFDSSELTLPPFLQPSQTNAPPIPGLSPSSESHEDNLTHEPEPEVAPTQSMEEPLGKSQLHFFYSSQLFLTFPSNFSSSSHSTPLHHHHRRYAHQIPPPFTPTPVPSPVPPRNWLPPPLIPTMRLTRNLPTYN